MGRIVGENVTDIRFRARYGSLVNVGEMLVADDVERGCPFLLRVYDVGYGAEAAGEDWMERTAGGMLFLDESGEEPRLSDKDRRLYLDISCMPLGYVKDGELRRAKSIPSHFSGVRRAGGEDYAVLTRYMGDVEVGFLRSGEDVLPIRVGLDGERAFPFHVGVFATTGMGKSNLMKCLAGSVMRGKRCGMLILDPHGEYYDGGGGEQKGLRDNPLAQSRMDVYSARKLSGPYNTIKLSASEIQVSDLFNIYEFSVPQKEALGAAAYKLGPNWLVELHDRTPEELKAGALDKSHEGTISVVQRRIEHLFRYDLISRDPKVSMTRSVVGSLRDARVVLVDTSNMYETEELLVSTVLARAVFEHNKQLYGEPEKFKKLPPMLITIEEAQRVLSGGATVFSQVAREGRKFKTGLCAISQQPKLIDNQVLSQFNTLFILGLADRRDREILRDSAKQDISKLDNEVQMLMQGEALVASPFTPFAVPVKIHLYEEYLSEFEEKGGGMLGGARSGGGMLGGETKGGETKGGETKGGETKVDPGFF